MQCLDDLIYSVFHLLCVGFLNWSIMSTEGLVSSRYKSKSRTMHLQGGCVRHMITLPEQLSVLIPYRRLEKTARRKEAEGHQWLVAGSLT